MEITNIVCQIVESIIKKAVKIKEQKAREQTACYAHTGSHTIAIFSQVVTQNGSRSEVTTKPKQSSQEIAIDRKQHKQDNLASRCLNTRPQPAKEKQNETIFPNKIIQASVKPHKNQTHFDKLVKVISDKEKAMVKLQLHQPESRLPSAKRQQLLKQKSDKEQSSVKIKCPQENKKLAQHLRNHIRKGKTSKFTYGNAGELLLFCSKELTPLYLPAHFQENYCLGPQTSSSLLSARHHIESDSTPIHNKKRVDCQPSSKSGGTSMKASEKLQKSLSAGTPSVLSSRNQPSSTSIITSQNPCQRDKLYSNNGDRQTSNLPYFKAVKGAKYAEINSKTGVHEKTKCEDDEEKQQPFKKSKSSYVFTFKSHLEQMNSSKSKGKALFAREGSLTKLYKNPSTYQTQTSLSIRSKQHAESIKAENMNFL